MKFLHNIRVAIWNFFTAQRFNKEFIHKQLETNAQTIIKLSEDNHSLMEKNSRLETENKNLENSIRAIVGEYTTFVDFIASRQKPEDFGDDLQPIPEIRLAQATVQQFKRYADNPDTISGLDVQFTTMYQAKTGLPREIINVMMQTLLASLDREIANIKTDDEGGYNAHSLNEFLVKINKAATLSFEFENANVSA